MTTFREEQKAGKFLVTGSGQDKGLGPKWAKSLSAHRFLWARAILGWASDSAQTPLPYRKTAGPRPNTTSTCPAMSLYSALLGNTGLVNLGFAKVRFGEKYCKIAINILLRVYHNNFVNFYSKLMTKKLSKF